MFKVSFIPIFIIYKVHSKSNSVTGGPLKIIQQWPSKISLNIRAFPIYTKERREIQLEFYNSVCVCVCVCVCVWERERERERERLHLLDSPKKIPKMVMVILKSLLVSKGFLKRQGSIIEFTHSYKYSWGNLASNGNLITSNNFFIFHELVGWW